MPVVSRTYEAHALGGGANSVTARYIDDRGREHFYAWNSLAVDIAADVDSRIPRVDEKIRTEDASIVAYSEIPPTDAGAGDASPLDTFVGKLRVGYNEVAPENSYRRTKQCDDYRTSKGLTWAQVRAQIQADPKYNMSDSEWAATMARWDYLNVPTRIQTMQNYNNLVQGDTWNPN